MASLSSTQQKLENMKEAIVCLVTNFLLSDALHDKLVLSHFNCISDRIPTKGFIKASLHLTKLLDQYSALKLAYWANNYNTLFLPAIKQKENEATEYTQNLCKMFDIDYLAIEKELNPWWERVSANPESHGKMTKQLIENLRTVLGPIYPDKDRTAAVDKALSEAGLPTSTESEESWWQRLLEKPC